MSNDDKYKLMCFYVYQTMVCNLRNKWFVYLLLYGYSIVSVCLAIAHKC